MRKEMSDEQKGKQEVIETVNRSGELIAVRLPFISSGSDGPRINPLPAEPSGTRGDNHKKEFHKGE